MEQKRVIVYIDGFNFYYGIKNKPWNKYYWIYIVALFEQFMRENQELIKVKYFSARPLDNKGKFQRQNAFFQANQNNDKFQLILGKYQQKNINCKNCNSIIPSYEEKQSDVNLATQIVTDAYQDNCDVIILVSADSDMIPAIKIAMLAGKEVYAYFPPTHNSGNIRHTIKGKPIMLERYRNRFKKALMPDTITLKNGFTITIPDSWKALQQ